MIFKHVLRACIGVALLGTSAAALAEGIDDPVRPSFYDAMKGARVVFVPQSMSFDLPQGWGAALNKQAKELGYTVDIRDPNWKTDAGASAITTAIGEKPDIIIVQNPDVKSYARLYKKAADEGIYVLQINMNSSQATEAYVGPDWVGMGALAAARLAEVCSPAKGKSGKIAVMQGDLTAAASTYQIKGFTDELAKHSDITLVSNQSANWDASKAQSIATTVLQQHPDLCGYFGFWDVQDMGIAAAVKEAGKTGEVYVMSSGGGSEQSMCENVRNGSLTADISFDVPGQARDLNNMIKYLLQTRPKAGETKAILYTPLNVVTKDNLHAGSCYELKDLQ
ncbi:MAG: sugar ABC transporter substrate-binding protein [Rhizobiaceae bacterium]|nr:sugar ABC transporter substrate-binding protein [Rhizobiaceae bacterium]